MNRTATTVPCAEGKHGMLAFKTLDVATVPEGRTIRLLRACIITLH